MFDHVLFIGFAVSNAYSKELDRLSFVERELFIQSCPSPYLQQIESQGVVYLGKLLGPSIQIAELDAFCSHLFSLLKKLVPHFPYEQDALCLLTLPSEKISSTFS